MIGGPVPAFAFWRLRRVHAAELPVAARVLFWLIAVLAFVLGGSTALGADGCSSHTFTAAEGDGFVVAGFVPAGAAITSVATETTVAWDAGASTVQVSIDGYAYPADPSVAAAHYVGFTVASHPTGDALFGVDQASTIGSSSFVVCYVGPAQVLSSGGGGDSSSSALAQISDQLHNTSGVFAVYAVFSVLTSVLTVGLLFVNGRS